MKPLHAPDTRFQRRHRRMPRPYTSIPAAAVLAGIATFLACSDATGPAPETVDLELHVSGGIAGIDFTLRIDGRERTVIGVSCIAGCAFRDGEVLLGISGYQISDLADDLEDAGVFGFDGNNFGIQCCDQFAYDLAYDRSFRSARLSGSSGALPDGIARVLARVHALNRRVLPAIVDFGRSPDAWPGRPLTVDSLTLNGSDLTAYLTWGGGCQAHAIDLVFWNGFLESNPVQVSAVFAHDDRNDLCDALVFETRRFDLTPLRTAWEEAYGPGPGTIIIGASPPGGQSTTVEYTF